VNPRRPIFGHRPVPGRRGSQHYYWLRDIMRDAGCTAREREAMERHIDGESLPAAAAAMGLSNAEGGATIASCRDRLELFRADVEEVLLAAARDLLLCGRNTPARGGSTPGHDDSPSYDRWILANDWEAWVFGDTGEDCRS